MLFRDLDRLELLARLNKSKTIIVNQSTSQLSQQQSGAFQANVPTGAGLQGQYSQAIIDAINNFKLPQDNLGRIKISLPVKIFDSDEIYTSTNRDPLWTNVQVSGTTSVIYQDFSGNLQPYVNERSSVLLETPGTGKIYRQTRRYFRCSPGNTLLALISGKMSDNKYPTIYQRVGMFDDWNGFFIQRTTQPLEQTSKVPTEPEYAFVRRYTVPGQNTYSTSVSEDYITQSAWNLDTLDGSKDENNPSGIKLTLSNVFTHVIQWLWIGTGAVLQGFYIDGHIIWCHLHTFSNKSDEVYIGSPHLPIRYEIELNAGVSEISLYDDTFLECISASIFTEGYDNIDRYQFAYTTDITRASTSYKSSNTDEPIEVDREYNLFAIRPNLGTSTLPIARYVEILLKKISVTTSSYNALVRIYYIPDSSSLSLTWSKVSSTMYNITSLAEFSTIMPMSIPSDAIILDSFLVPAQDGVTYELKLNKLLIPSIYKDSAGTLKAGCYMITVSAETMTTINFAVTWQENY